MAVTVGWDETDPANTDDPRDGALDIRTFKQAVRERVRMGGMFWETAPGTDADAGKICAGVQSANVLEFYESDKTTLMEHWNDSTKVVEDGDGVTGVNPYTRKVDALECLDLDAGKDEDYNHSPAALTALVPGVLTYRTIGSTVKSSANKHVQINGYLICNHVVTTDVIDLLEIEVDPQNTGAWVLSAALNFTNITPSAATLDNIISFSYLAPFSAGAGHLASTAANFRVRIRGAAANANNITISRDYYSCFEIA